MRVGYGYSHPRRRISDADFAHANVDRVWLDTEKTDRENRAFLIKKDIRDGDVVVLLRESDLGAGGEVPIIRKAIADAGCTIEICEPPATAPGRRGPKPAWQPSPADDKVLRAMWKDQVTYTREAVLRAAEARTGTRPSRHQMIRRFGNRGD